MNASSVYIQYKVNVSENQADILKDAIRLKKGATLCFPKGGHVLLTSVQISTNWTRHKWKGDMRKFV